MIEIVYLGDDFVVVDKPPGVSFHSEDGTPGLFEQVKDALSLTELFPVHRLDKITSGLVIFAKTKDTAAEFGELFEQRKIEKYYLALSAQKPKKKQGWVKGDMVKARRGAYKLTRSSDNPAITQFISANLDEGKRLFLVKPHSGKTHQIRVALKSVGSPIYGDTLYGGLEADRGYLHAFGLKFSIGTEEFDFVRPPKFGEHFLSDAGTTVMTQQWAKPWELFKGK